MNNEPKNISPPDGEAAVANDDPRLFDEWTAEWQDLVEFDIVPVSESKEAAEAIAHQL